MKSQTIGNFLTVIAILLLQPGCASLRDGKEASGTVAVQELTKTTRSWDGQRLPSYPKGQPEVTIRRIRIPAGARLHTHLHPVINAGMLISGQLTVVRADGKKLYLKAGDPIVELVNTVHYGINEGTEDVDIVIVYAGAVGMQTTVLK